MLIIVLIIGAWPVNLRPFLRKRFVIMSIESSAIAQAIESEITKQPFSGVVSVHEKGSVVFQSAFGMANRAESIPNSINTRFAMASGCKIFTAVAICQLVQQGKLAFETRLRDCLDIDFPHFDDDVTVHHLLTHSSGIPDYFDEEENDDYEALWHERPMYRMRRLADFLPMFQSEKMKFRPGEKFTYNDGGFIVLGLIVEQLSKITFTEYVSRHIMTPAGMTDSGYFATDRLPARTAVGYIEDESGGGWRSNIFAVPIIGGADGGAYTTTADMARFWSALLGHELLNEEITRRMMRIHIEAKSEGEDKYYGYGIWMTGDGTNVDSYYVTGWDPGVAMISEYFPAGEVLLTVIANANRPAFSVYRAVREAIRSS